MAYFPDRVMPKALRKETWQEVDGSPLIYNAADFNRHHREIIAIESLLLNGSNVSEAVALAETLLARIASGDLMAHSSGLLKNGQAVQVPAGIAKTSAAGPVGTADATITVASTEGFPDSGYVTKFNAMALAPYCHAGGAPMGAGCPLGTSAYMDYLPFVGTADTCKTNQEVIRYRSKTATTLDFCDRGVDGTTAQALAGGETALVVSGKAAVSFSPFFGAQDWSKQLDELCVGHDARLVVTAYAMELGQRFTKVMDTPVVTAYSLSVVGWFDLPEMSQLYSLG